jgi:Zn-dependent membrane protease YugP
LLELVVVFNLVHRPVEFGSVFRAIENVVDDGAGERIAFGRFQFTPQLKMT